MSTDDWSTIPSNSSPGSDSLRRVRSNLEFWRGKDQLGRLLFVLDGSPPSIKIPDRLPAGLEIQIVDKEQNKKRLILTLIDQDATDIFRALCSDLLKAAETLPQERHNEGMTFILERIVRWHELLTARRSTLLSPSQAIGLLGELYFLRDIIIQKMGFTLNAAACWRGSFGDEQDFLFNDIIFEIKTQLNTSDRFIFISSEDQLDTLSGEIVLVHQTLTKAVENIPNASSLGKLVDELYSGFSKADPAAGDLFMLGLIEARYISRPEYFSDFYKLHARDYFHVKETFPRIVRAELRSGVDKVGYRIALHACQQFKVNEDLVFKEIASNAGK